MDRYSLRGMNEWSVALKLLATQDTLPTKQESYHYTLGKLAQAGKYAVKNGPTSL